MNAIIMNAKALYKKYFLDNGIERTGLFKAVANRYAFEHVLYAGGFIHVAPSFYFKSVVYVDTDKNAKKFFAEPEVVAAIISAKQQYEENAEYRFIGADYTSHLDLHDGEFDFLISQYAGIISRPCKKYLKIGGILLANDSHGDAGVAKLDGDFELIAAIDGEGDQYQITEEALDQYFIPKRNRQVTLDELIALGKGIKYKVMAGNYLFRRIR